jgi:hypothetical protein
MANGYIGKISALVTASTADLSRKLQGSAKDVDRFAKSVQSQVTAASRNAQNSLNSIFTPLQKLERALKAAGGQLNLLRPGQAAEIRSFVSAAEGINKPLEAAQRQFAGLSSEVAGRFIPALNRAQEAALQVNEQIGRTGVAAARNFREAQQAVEAFAQSQARVAQIDRAAASGRTGREAEFVSPRALQTLREAAALSERASQLSPAALQDGGVARQVQRLQTFRNAIARTVAEVEEIRLRPQVDTAALAAAERRLDNIVETTRAAQQELEQIVNRGADAQRRAAAASRFLQVDQRESQLQSFEGQATTRDASGRTIQERVAAINATNQRAQAEANLRSEQERRIAVANTLLQIDQRESQLQSFEGQATTRDASGRTIQERVAAINATNQRAEAEARLRAEQEARLAVANSLLQVDQRESDLLSQRGRSTDLGNRLAEQGRRRVRGLTGDINIDATPPPGAGFGDNFSGQAQRDIDALGTRVGAVRQQLETLPNSIRTRFIPELQRAQAQLVRLQNSPIATVQAIENATQRVQRLEAAARRASEAFNFRQSFGGAGLRGIEEGLNQQALQGYTAQLQILQQTLAGTSQAARGPAVVAFNNLRNAIADAMDRGALETEQTRRVIQGLTQDAVRATAAAAGIGERGLGRRLQRAGDIGRGAFGNLGLGIQQAVFAVDDFFSVTGGLDQRIRAAGNNISQLGFVLGGTAGLITGVAVSLGAQLVAALIRFSNNGQGAEDQAKALNDALERQRSIVDDLRQAFDSLAGTLAEGVFSDANKDLREFAEEIRKLEKQQARARGDVAAARDPRTVAIGADISVVDRALQAETNPARAQILARRRRELQESSDRVRSQVASAPAPSPAATSDLLRRIGDGILSFARAPQTRSVFEDRTLQARGREISAAGSGLPAGQNIAARRAQLAALREAEGQLGAILESPRGRLGVSRRIDVSRDLGNVQGQISVIERELSAAAESSANGSLAVIERTGRSIAENLEILESAFESNIGGAVEAIDRQEQLGAQLRDARDRLTEAFAIDDRAERSRVVESLEAEIRQIEASQKARQSEVSAIQSVLRSSDTFAAALDRLSGQLVDAVVGDARGAADQARRSANRLQGQAAAGFGQQRDADFALRQRRRQEGAAADIEARAAGIEEQERQLRLRFQQAAGAGRLGANAQDLIRRRDAAQAVLDNRQSAPADRVAAEGVVAEANRRLQQLFESFPEVQRLAGLADALDAAAQGAIEFGNAVEQGRNLVLTDGQRAADDFIAQVQKINAALDDGEVGQDQRRAAIDRLRQDGLRQLAPNIFGLADQVANAVLQGPSRAALQATDVSTVEGSRELNRLLRGEDSARDQPLIELQREANKIAERIARGVENNEAKLAN